MMIVIALVAQPSFTTRNGQEGFSDEYLSLISRFQNFGEDVFRWLRDKKGAGEVDFKETDGPSGQFTVREVKASMLRRVLHWLEEEGARQHLPISLDVQTQ
jgi:hypothetical protein